MVEEIPKDIILPIKVNFSINCTICGIQQLIRCLQIFFFSGASLYQDGEFPFHFFHPVNIPPASTWKQLGTFQVYKIFVKISNEWLEEERICEVTSLLSSLMNTIVWKIVNYVRELVWGKSMEMRLDIAYLVRLRAQREDRIITMPNQSVVGTIAQAWLLSPNLNGSQRRPRSG